MSTTLMDELLGLYTYRHKKRHILLNSNMGEMVKLMVCGHEITFSAFMKSWMERTFSMNIAWTPLLVRRKTGSSMPDMLSGAS